MGQASAAAALGILLGVAGGSFGSAAFLQSGHDPDRSGVIPEGGPAWGDVAWTLRLPGSRAPAADPLLLGRSVYVATADLGFSPSLSTNAVFRIGYDDATPALVVALDRRPLALASDGERLFVLEDGRVEAFDLAGGSPLWAWSYPRLVREPLDHVCDPPAVRSERLYVHCAERATTFPEATRPATEDANRESRVFLASLSVHDGTPEWIWYHNATEEVARKDVGLPAAPLSTSVTSRPNGFGLIGPYVLAVTRDLAGQAGYFHYYVWALAAEDGKLLWSTNSTTAGQATYLPRIEPGGGVATSSGLVPNLVGPTGTSSVAYFQIDGDLAGLAPAGGKVLWRADLKRASASSAPTGSGLGLAGDALLVSTSETLFRFNRSRVEEVWHHTLPVTADLQARQYFEDGPLLSDARAIYAATVNSERTLATLRAFGRAEGNDLWSIEVPSPAYPMIGGAPVPVFRFAVAEGALALAGLDGNVTLVGSTDASLGPDLQVSTSHPPIGEPVEASLEATRPGLFGPASAFRAEWGDGTSTPWQPDPVLSHVYDQRGPHEARFWVRNAAGQTASLRHVFHAGEEEPAAATGEAPANPYAESGIAGETPAPEIAPPSSGLAAPALLAVLALAVAGTAVLAVVAFRRSGAGTATAPVPAAPPEPPAPGKRFLGKYEVVREIGSGAQGVTWLAVHAELQRRVVLKRLRPELLADPEARRRFLREARILAGLDHPNVVRIHDVEIVGESGYLVMEFVEGGSLEAGLRGTFPLAEAARVVLDVLDGLAYIHARGILHRDIKPGNVLLTIEGTAKIADFGIARELGRGDVSETIAGSTPLGTPLYMSPEHVRGGTLDLRSDLYAVAVMFFELATGRFYLGRRPGSEIELWRAILHERPVLPPGDFPPAVQDWTIRALEKDPAQRFQTAPEMRDALLGALGPGFTRPRTPGTRTPVGARAGGGTGSPLASGAEDTVAGP